MKTKEEFKPLNRREQEDIIDYNLTYDYNKGFKEGKQQTLKDVDKFIEEHTFAVGGNDDDVFRMIRIIPFEWEDFKKELGEMK
jgi:hypothetical protein